jgi:hypothetical protein|tara:strand:+ start:8430 stop:8981 length:552 start_codon:yes stop_codon:yes gene_type:complete
MSDLWPMIDRLNRVAVVTDKSWVRGAARVESLFFPNIDYETFRLKEQARALAWVCGTEAKPHDAAWRILPMDDPRLAGFEIDRHLSAEDAKAAVADMRAIVDAGATRLLGRISHFGGFAPDLMADTKLISGKSDLVGKLEKYAIVGAPDWMEAMAKGVGAFMPVDIRTFDADEESNAVTWLKA